MNSRWIWLLAAAGMVAMVVGLGGCQVRGPAAYETPGAAVEALVTALKAEDDEMLEEVFGEEGEDILSSGDDVADAKGRADFLGSYLEKHTLTDEGEGVKVLSVGGDDWPFAVPLVKTEAGWVFDAAAGKEEILNRRIGRNELDAIQVCMAILDAQVEYARMDPDKDNLPDYAAKVVSSPGQRDGLYWPAVEGEKASPLGPLVAGASEEGYGKGRSKGAYHGYRYRLLKKQGPAAEGGEMDYEVKGQLLGGFAVVAWPAEYGNSGVMTFVVSHHGKVYQKDLGKGSASASLSGVKGMRWFNPDGSWSEVGG